jgi:hypothetical protein
MSEDKCIGCGRSDVTLIVLCQFQFGFTPNIMPIRGREFPEQMGVSRICLCRGCAQRCLEASDDAREVANRWRKLDRVKRYVAALDTR